MSWFAFLEQTKIVTEFIFYLIFFIYFSADQKPINKGIGASLKIDKDTTSKQDTKSRSIMYFSQLSKLQIRKLFEMYAFDFELFDYDADEYFQINETS